MQKLNVNSNKNGIITNVGVSAEIKNSVPRKSFPKKNCSSKRYSNKFKCKKVTFKAKNVYIIFAFLLVIIALLIVASIYCCFIKQHLLSFHVTNNKLEKVLYS